MSVEVFDDVTDDAAVAAGRRPAGVSHTERGHVKDCRCLRMEYVLLPAGPAVRNGGRSLDRDPPALRICMETTRASLLWQAAAVRPEPEGMPSLRCAVPTRGRCIARVWDSSCFVILTNVAARVAWSDAPSSRRNLSGYVLSVRD